MKKKLLVLLFIFIYGIASAQFTIWENDFDAADVSDWTFIDEDGDGNGWMPYGNIELDLNTGTLTKGAYKVLGNYNIELTYGNGLPGVQKNWAITPAIDLSYYAGSMELNLTAQKAVYSLNDDLLIYVSTTDTAPGSFTLVKNLLLTRVTAENPEFQDFIIDLSPYVGQSQVYIAFTNTDSFTIGYEIDKMSITAEKLGLNDVEANGGTLLKQNPVKDYLQLHLSDTFNKEETKLKIYNTAGSFVQESKYDESGVSVGNLPNGIYFLTIEEGTTIQKLKFIKQ
ncbi:MAG: T9SS type A sorting domain-containing protein [Flavobacterium sp.]|nr:MAG: T9SS type A sorting domain-containing protein [Flavobacterium sp.]